MILLLNQTAAAKAAATAGMGGLEKVILDPDLLSLVGCAAVALVMLVRVIRGVTASRALRHAANADAEFDTAFRNSAHVLALFQNGGTVAGSPRGTLYSNTCRELAFHLIGSDVVDQSFSIRLRASGRIMPTQWQATQRAAGRSLEEFARWLAGLAEQRPKSLPALGLAVSLLAVMGHAGADTLDFAAAASCLRPLVLALLCHVLGMWWHAWMVRRTRAAVAALEDFSADLAMLMDRNYVDHRHPMEALPSLGGMGMVDEPGLTVTPRAAAHVRPRNGGS